MRYSKIICMGMLALSTISCRKLLDIKETDVVGGDVALLTVANNEQAVLGGYAGITIEMSYLLNATFSDEVKKSEFYNATTIHEWQFNSTDIQIRDNYTAINPNYTVIDRVNRVLAALPGADSVKLGDESLRIKLKGEALFLRAYAHFELFRYYCSNYDANGLAMPYMDSVSRTPITQYERINMGPYFEKLKADLAAAKPLLPNNVNEINRANRFAVSALQARVALYMKDWAAAESFASEYINLPALSLASRAEFPGIWKDSTAKEVAFRIVKTATVGPRFGSLWRATSVNADNIGVVTWQPTDKLWNSFDQTNDIRFASYVKNEPSLASKNRPSKLIQKYAGTTYGSAAENVANAKVYRTAEMYLIRAEARAEQNKFSGAGSASEDINTLRTARINGYTNVSFTSKAEAIDAIMLERFKELAFEGHRFWDLRRRGLPVSRVPAEAPSAAGTTLPAGDYRFILPIPLNEIQSNPAMKQNPGY